MFQIKSLDPRPLNQSVGLKKVDSGIDNHFNTPYLESLDGYRRDDKDYRLSPSRVDSSNNKFLNNDSRALTYGKSATNKLESPYHIQQDEEDDYHQRVNRASTSNLRGTSRLDTFTTPKPSKHKMIKF